ncbi:MAG: hypothetical protein F2662_02120 [Actinobacteria bacterium]|nr:hypothetical protein [Actinomycetota bacterium]
MKTLFVYVDESGNFDFTSRGTRHLVLGVFCTNKPVQNSLELSMLKYETLAQGIDLANFHASEDLQQVRDRVFDVISKIESCSSVSFWISKEKHKFTERSAVGAYKFFGVHIARYIGEVASQTLSKKVVVVFDKALVRQDQNAFLAAIKPQLATLGLPYYLYFHNVSKDFNGQIADYLAWARFVSLERNEHRPLAILPNHLKEVLEIRETN